MTRSTCTFILVLASTALFSGLVRAESPPPECLDDEGCPGGERCAGEVCIAVELICTHSDDCADGQICDIGYSSCPGECSFNEASCPERCRVPNGFCSDLPSPTCQADADCGQDQLCTVTLAPTCAEGDLACQDAPRLGCADFLRFCGPEEDFFSCAAQETCNADGRCIWTDGGEEVLGVSETVEVDQDKARRLRAQWIEDIESAQEADRGDGGAGGCTSAPGRSGPPTGLLLVALALALGRRQRRARAPE